MPEILQIITTLCSIGAFGMLLKNESRLTRVETLIQTYMKDK